MEITFLIRIKEGVSLPGLECEAFAGSMAYAICAQYSEQLILAQSVTRFNTDFHGSGFKLEIDSIYGPKISVLS